MPVILAKEDCDFWLDPGMNHVEALDDFSSPFDAERMRTYLVAEERKPRQISSPSVLVKG